jgi:preprotein translocase subunit SecA
MDETISSTCRSRTKDPLLIYKFEAFNLFNGMLNGVNKELFRSYSKEICQQSAPDIKEARGKISKDEVPNSEIVSW